METVAELMIGEAVIDRYTGGIERMNFNDSHDKVI